MIPECIYLYRNVYRLVSSAGPRCNIMPTINVFLFLRLNGSVNGLKPRTYYYYYYYDYYY